MSLPPQNRQSDVHYSLQEILESLGTPDSVEAILYSFLQNRIRDVVFVLEVMQRSQYRFLYVNAAFESITGLPPSFVVGKLVEEVIPPGSLSLVRSKYQQAIDTRQSVHWDEVSEYPTGTKTGEVTVLPVFSPEGTCAALIGTVHDVTERHQAHAYLAELEERSRLALEASGSGAFDWHRKTNQVSLSEQCRHILGYVYEKLDFDLASFDRIVHPEDCGKAIALLQQVLSGELATFSAEFRGRHLYGYWVWLRCQGRAFRDSEGNVNRIFGTISNITVEKEAEKAMEQASLVFGHSSEAIAITDVSGRITMVNPGFTRMRGYRGDEVIGHTAELYNAEMAGQNSYETLRSWVIASGHWRGEVWSRHKDGHLIAENRSITAVKAPNGSVLNFIEIASDITKTKEAEELLWRQANYDGLTGLPNRHLFLDRLRQAIRNSHRGDHPAFSLLFIDLDQFKEVNDTLGHSMGDRLLKEAAQRLLRCTRDTDTVSRLSGDEFTILLLDMHNSDVNDPHAIERVAQAIIDAIAQPFDIDGETVHISASIGIAHFPGDAQDVESVLKHADQAMYEAKLHGRNRFVYFSPAMEERAQVRRRLRDDLRIAIQRGELHLHYQPILVLATARIVKAEALLRWQHPKHGWICPAEFIPVAEESGLILEIGEWVFHAAVADAARWICQQGHAIQVSINVSPVQIASGEESCGRCMAFLASQHLPRHAIVIEVTEGSLLRNDPTVERQLRQLAIHGIALAIDDFGTGYSALSYLQQYQFEYLKIDRAFVRNMEVGSTKLALCKTIIAMAHTLGMRVIAEGISEEHEADLLRHAGCDFGQGYFFYQPMPAASFEHLLLAKHH
jgi:diguanylate cyclase (GGDEF)-like protein/PAS domain S-box-containing protein